MPHTACYCVGMDDGYVIVRNGALRDLLDLARRAADEINLREPGSALASCMNGAVGEILTDLTEPAFA